MTLILAAKNYEGIVTWSDTVGYIKRDNDQLVEEVAQKVRAIGDGNVIMGFQARVI